MNFRERMEFEAKYAPAIRRRRIQNILANPKAMQRAEQAARDKLGLGAKDKVDWASSSIDFKTLLVEVIIPILLKLFAGL